MPVLLILEAAELGEVAYGAYRAYRLARTAQAAVRAAQAADRLAKAAQTAQQTLQATAEAKGCATCPKQEVPCFKTPENGTDAELDRQLQEQQDAINKMSPDELLKNFKDNRDVVGNVIRPAGDAAARQAERATAEKFKAVELRDEYSKTMPFGEAKDKAASDAANWIRGQAATHTPDIVAGGDGTITGTGSRSVNSSIGAQWNQGRSASGGKTRAKVVEQEARNAKARGDKTMDVSLDRCGKAGS